MLFRTSEQSPNIGITSSIEAANLEIRGESMQFGLSAPSEIPFCREEAESSARMEARRQLPRDVRRLIEDVLSSGRPLREVEDHLDWLENTRLSAKPA